MGEGESMMSPNRSPQLLVSGRGTSPAHGGVERVARRFIKVFNKLTDQ